MDEINGFAPIARADAKVLILGSMPSIASKTKEQYYGHPQNAFWLIMGDLFGAGPEHPYETRERILTAQKVAIWDVLQKCRRVGSLDSNIDTDSIVVNDFESFFRFHAGIRNVFFNGATPEAIYRRRVQPFLADEFKYLVYHRMPSTSPANAAKRFHEKLDVWRQVAQHLAEPPR